MEGHGAAVAKATVGSGFAEELFVWDSIAIQMDDLCNSSDIVKPFERSNPPENIGIWILNEPSSKVSNWPEYVAKNIGPEALFVDLLPAKCALETQIPQSLVSQWIGLFPLFGLSERSVTSETAPWLLTARNFDIVPLRRAEMLVHALDGRPAQVTPEQNDKIVAWTHLAPILYRRHFERSIKSVLNPIDPDLVDICDWLCLGFGANFEQEMRDLRKHILGELKLD